MKLVINYDLIEEIKNANEPYGIIKLIRCYKRFWIKFGIPMSVITSLPAIIDNSFLPVFTSLTTFNTLFPLLCDNALFRYFGDIHYKDAKDRLLSLIILLRENNINTDYELLLDSYEYERKYNLKLNEDKLVQVLESKYILMPTYNYNMKVVDTSILQEHILGSNDYVLSFGSPEKKLKLVMERV